MPYDVNTPPDRISSLDKESQRVWIDAFNAATESGVSEEEANKIAWQTVSLAIENKSWRIKKMKSSYFIPSEAEGRFKTTVPIALDNNNRCRIVRKTIGDGDNKKEELFIEGVASNKIVDKQGDFVSDEFLGKMVASVPGINVFMEHKHHLFDTLGVVDSAQIADEELRVAIKLEPPEENNLVERLLTKMGNGLKVGLSIGGEITKAVKETVDGAIARKLLDGEVYEISVTALPAVNSKGWLTPLVKSLHAVCDSGIEFSIDNGTISLEKSWDESVVINELPQESFAVVGDVKDRKTWIAPHHFGDGTISPYALIKAAESIDQDTPQAVISHVSAHLDTIFNGNGIEKARRLFDKSEEDIIVEIGKIKAEKDFEKEMGVDPNVLMKAIAERVEMQELRDKLREYWWTFQDMTEEVVFADELTPKEKETKIKIIAEDFSRQVQSVTSAISALIDEIAVELSS